MDERELYKEALIMKKSRHPNIVKYHDAFLENGELHIVMEYVDYGDL